MKCPYCDKEMQEGSFRIGGRQHLAWTPKGKKAHIIINKTYDYEVLLAKRPLITYNYVKVYRCDSCCIEIINEKDLKVGD